MHWMTFWEYSAVCGHILWSWNSNMIISCEGEVQNMRTLLPQQPPLGNCDKSRGGDCSCNKVLTLLKALLAQSSMLALPLLAHCPMLATKLIFSISDIHHNCGWLWKRMETFWEKSTTFLSNLLLDGGQIYFQFCSWKLLLQRSTSGCSSISSLRIE